VRETAGNVSIIFHLFTKRKMAVLFLLGFSSGLPLALTAGTLMAWMTVEGVDIKTIGIAGLTALPYTLKFLWSPIMDRFTPPFLGRRRGWLVITQLALLLLIVAMAHGSPSNSPLSVALLAFSIAFASASQDIVADAYRTDILDEDERGIGVALFVTGYRLGMLISGAVALILSEQIGWQNTWLSMGLCLLIGIFATIFAKEPVVENHPPASMKEAVIHPFRDFLSRPKPLLILLLIILYKLGDAYAGILTTPFLIRGAGFSPAEVGVISKGFGLFALIFGAMFGGTLMIRLGLYRSLLWFGVLQAVSNLSFSILAVAGRNYPLMMFSIGFENLCGGMGTSAFVALLMALCNRNFSATQYALLSALAAIGRVLIAPTSGFLVESVGWPAFFFITFLTALPGLFMLVFLRNTIADISHKTV